MLRLEGQSSPTAYRNSSKSSVHFKSKCSYLLVLLLIAGSLTSQVSGTSRNLLQSQRESLCSAWLGGFNETCSLQQNKQKFNGYIDYNTQSLAVCCRDDSCCKQLNGIIDAGCLELLDEHPQNGVLETIGLHATVCTDTAQKIPTSLLTKIMQNQVSVSQSQQEMEANQKCDNLSYQLVQQCGFLHNENTMIQIHRGSQNLECCWPTSCCSLSQQYYQAGCSPDCSGQDTQTQSYSRRIGSSIAELWKGACLLDTQDSVQCQNAQDKEDIDNQVKLVKFSDVGEDLFSNEIVQDGLFEDVQQQGLGEVCGDLQDVFYHLDIEVEALETFCQLEELSALSGFGNTQITGCCNIAEQIMDKLCRNSGCISQLPSFFTTDVMHVLFSWQVVCNPEIPTCPFVEQQLQQQYEYQNRLVAPFPPLQPITHISQTQQTKEINQFDQNHNLSVYSDNNNYIYLNYNNDKNNTYLGFNGNINNDIENGNVNDDFNVSYININNNYLNQNNNVNITNSVVQNYYESNSLLKLPDDFEIISVLEQLQQEDLQVEPQLNYIMNKNMQYTEIQSNFVEAAIQPEYENDTTSIQLLQSSQFSEQNNFDQYQKSNIINDLQSQNFEINSSNQGYNQNFENSIYIEINDRSNVSMFDVLGEIPSILFFNLAAQQMNLKQQVKDLNQKVMVFAGLDSAFHAFAQKSDMQTQDVIDGIRSGQLTNIIKQNVLTQFINLNLAIQKPVQGTALNGENLSVFFQVEQQSVWEIGCCQTANKAKVLSGSLFQEGLLAIVDTLVMPPDMMI